MSGRFGSRTRRGLALVWSAITIIYLAVVSAAIVRDPTFHLNVGVMEMTGRVALWPIMLPAVIGLVGLVLVLWHVKWGGWLLGAYSLFWASVLAAGLPAIWNVKTSFCTRTICITTPWIGRLLLFALATCFFLVALRIYLSARLRPCDSLALDAHSYADRAFSRRQ